MDATASVALGRAGVPRDLPLPDGRTVTLAAGRSRDGDALALMLGRCSATTTGGRWPDRVVGSDRALLRRLLGTQVVLCGWDRRRLVALANLSPWDGETARVGVLVEDDYQRRGLGTALTRVLADVALRLGYRRIAATPAGEASAARATLAQVGRVEAHGGVEGDDSVPSVRLPLPRWVTTAASPR